MIRKSLNSLARYSLSEGKIRCCMHSRLAVSGVLNQLIRFTSELPIQKSELSASEINTEGNNLIGCIRAYERAERDKKHLL